MKRYVLEMSNDFLKRCAGDYETTTALLKIRNYYLCYMITEIDAVKKMLEILEQYQDNC